MPRKLVYREYGGSLQVEIKTFDDLLEAVKIPETQWIATACPLAGLNCDKRFLEFMDTDKNGRVRVEEVRAAVAFAAKMFARYDGCDQGSDALDLERLSRDAAGLRATAQMILATLDRASEGVITLAEVRESERALRTANVNGDGIVAPAAIADARLRDAAEKIMSCATAKTNRAGATGVDPEMLAKFREQRDAALAHQGKRAEVFTWGADASLERARRVHALRARLDEYFLQCRLVATQPDAAERFRLTAERLDALMGAAPEVLEKAVAALPIAPPTPAGELVWARLHRGPLYEALGAFQREVVAAALGDAPALTEAQWRELVAKSEAILAWQASADADPLAKIAADLAGITEADINALDALCQADLAQKDKLDAIADLERLILYQRWLLTFANNFISMPDVYHPKKLALFERGYLVLAGRKFTFSVLVPDRAAHTRLTEHGTTYLAYVKVQRGETDAESFEVAVPVTAGTSAGFEVGKRGIFVGPDGREFDAVVTHLVVQPVSIWEAITQPFVRIGRFVSSRIKGVVESADAAANKRLEAGAAGAHSAATDAAAARERAHATGAPEPATTRPAAPGTPATPAAAPAAAAPGAGVGNVVAIASIAIAAVSAALASILGVFTAMTMAQRINALLGLLAIICVPSGVLGWLKLRQRNLALLLEGSGWALNDRLKITRELAAMITRRPARPKNSTVERFDLAVFRRHDDEAYEPEQGLALRYRALVAVMAIALTGWVLREPLGHLLARQSWWPWHPAASQTAAPPESQPTR